ncbi:NUDIX domain-containing protein [Caenimonas aquaedulcis]|uniref:NUDIX domain-containing protein n=1 Tax=Caenimonas aquaedulcis TaxID=2793270 RepID=A0A931H2E5_9BURK|nr:NUDIX domain-containing protein [Caenimonas aquaedulcis]MBG9387270.1 NUDIX domain-containing protein [Caenimonas aquaedulcis]
MKQSAGLLMYRRAADGTPEVLLGHPGGPLWRSRDDGAWTVPKGGYEAPEEALAAAVREFTEETGHVPSPPYLPLGEVRQKSGKRVQAWACEGDLDPGALASIAFEMEWPPRSGRMQSFPELDRIGWFTLAQAREKLLPAQTALLDRLAVALSTADGQR